MNSKNNSKKPYIKLGSQLKQLRQNNNETLIDVSDAVEIDSIQLAKYEAGQLRPSEDVLELLINHFKAQDELADTLWQMAGYIDADITNQKINSEQVSIRHDIVVMPIDPRVIYTDKAQVTVNDYGVVLNFMQSPNANLPSMPVSRVGMSKEHAKNLLNALKSTLDQSESKNQSKLSPPEKQ